MRRYLGCTSPDCGLCKNNPNKRCPSDDNFDEAYADNQVIKSKCDSEVHVELLNDLTGEAYAAQGVEVQVSRHQWNGIAQSRVGLFHTTMTMTLEPQ